MFVKSRKKLRILIASGPTQEPIDPVRFLTNYSTGTMGRHLSSEAVKRGHAVTRVECPKDAQTALQLEKKLATLLPKNDVLIMAAAVCDVRPRSFSNTKIKKDRLSAIPLVKNPDILANLAKIKRNSQIFIGFGLESSNVLGNGFRKLREKKLEVIVLQKVAKNNLPFGEKPVDVLIVDQQRKVIKLKSVSKRKLAGILVQKAESFC